MKVGDKVRIKRDLKNHPLQLGMVDALYKYEGKELEITHIKLNASILLKNCGSNKYHQWLWSPDWLEPISTSVEYIKDL